jgi:hypothetical protein
MYTSFGEYNECKNLEVWRTVFMKLIWFSFNNENVHSYFHFQTKITEVTGKICGVMNTMKHKNTGKVE